MEDPSIVDFLESQGMPSDFASRRRLADQYGVQNYTGTAEQNTRLLGLLRGGAVGRVWATIKAALKLS
jgi:N-acetylmuramoyl-L-alanine amidase